MDPNGRQPSGPVGAAPPLPRQPRPGDRARNLALIHYWSVGGKTAFILLASMAVEMLVIAIVGTAYILEVPTFPFSAERMDSVLLWSGANMLLLIIAFAFTRLAIRLPGGDQVALGITIPTAVAFLALTGCMLGVFESLVWIIYNGYFVVGFIVLGPVRVLSMIIMLFVTLVTLSFFHAALPFTVYPYALTVDETLASIPMQMVMLHWLMAAVSAVVALTVITYLMGSWQSREKALRGEVRIDALTGVLNRRAIAQEIEAEMARAERANTELAVALIDIDHFKRVNDRYGHLRGDDVLVHVSNQIAAALRLTDTVGRFGGEEFVLLLPSCPLDGAAAILARLAETLAANPCPGKKPGEEPIAVTISAGVAMRRPDDDLTAVLTRADHALYLAKDSGRNCVRLETDL